MADVFYTDEQVTLYHGDALAVLSELPAESVHCVVTSPPYYGLRDYGTGRWVGGDDGCGHGEQQRVVPGASALSRLGGGQPASVPAPNATAICGCGAERVDQQYGLEPSPDAYVETMRAVFAQVRRVLAADGTLWLNLGDSYSSALMHNDNQPNQNRDGSKDTRARAIGHTIGRVTRPLMLPAKNLLGMPWRVAFALQADGWILRNAIVWDKPNAMPESVTDRLSTTYELVFLFAQSARYHFDLDAVREPHTESTLVRTAPHRSPGGKAMREGLVYAGTAMSPQTLRLDQAAHEAGRNPGDVWTIPTAPFPEAHFACMAPALAERCLMAGLPRGGVALDPFCGSGTTGMAAAKLGGRFVGIDLNKDYLELALRTRLAQSSLIDEEAS